MHEKTSNTCFFTDKHAINVVQSTLRADSRMGLKITYHVTGGEDKKGWFFCELS